MALQPGASDIDAPMSATTAGSSFPTLTFHCRLAAGLVANGLEPFARQQVEQLLCRIR